MLQSSISGLSTRVTKTERVGDLRWLDPPTEPATRPKTSECSCTGMCRSCDAGFSGRLPLFDESGWGFGGVRHLLLAG